MSLMDHAMNILGACQGEFSKADIKPGFTVTRICWDGCMATNRRVEAVGDVVRHAPSPHNDGRYPGAIVRYDRIGERWEPLAHFRKVDGELEVWS